MMNASVQRWSFEWKERWSDIWQDPVLEDWRAAASSSASGIFGRPELVRIWAETQSDLIGAKPCFGIATSGAGHRILLPWVVTSRKVKLGVLRNLGPTGELHFSYHDPIPIGMVDSDVNWPDFWQQAREAASAKCDEAVFPCVHAEYANSDFAVPCSTDCPVLDLETFTSLSDALQLLASRYRRELDRQTRRLAALGTMEHRVFSSTEAENALEDFQDGFLPAYAEVWNARPTGNMFNRAGMREFVQRVVREGLTAGWAYYATLSLNDKSVAWSIGFLDGEALYLWIPTYSRSLENFSPGKIQLAFLIDFAIQNRFKRIHLLRGDQHYKVIWHPRLPEIRTVRWFSPSMRGSALRLYRAARAQIV